MNKPERDEPTPQLPWKADRRLVYYPFGWRCPECDVSCSPTQRTCDSCRYRRPLLKWLLAVIF
jgi:hypothetical protein